MSLFSRIADATKPGVFAVCGISVTWIGGGGSAVATQVIRRDPGIEQASDDLWFADVEVRGADVPNPRKRDEVVWDDGTRYVVTKVRQEVNGNQVATLQRKGKP
jgi:hypothetical protein